MQISKDLQEELLEGVFKNSQYVPITTSKNKTSKMKIRYKLWYF